MRSLGVLVIALLVLVGITVVCVCFHYFYTNSYNKAKTGARWRDYTTSKHGFTFVGVEKAMKWRGKDIVLDSSEREMIADDDPDWEVKVQMARQNAYASATLLNRRLMEEEGN